MARGPKLLRLNDRRGFRRSVYLCAAVGIGILLVAPGASGLPAALSVEVTITGTPGSNGWYRGNVTVSWETQGETGEDPACLTRTLVADTPGTKITCKAWADIPPGEPIEEEITKSVTIRLDKTAPAIATVLERGADANGWYNRPLNVAFAGTDGTSGVSVCTIGRYIGPDNTSALIPGSCSDYAGNVATGSFAFKYDSTPPTLFAVTAKRANRSAQLAWRKSTDTQVVEVFRAPGRRGQGESGIYRGSATGFLDRGLTVGRKYEYRVVASDQAMNRAERRIRFVATGPLLSPAPGAAVSAPPFLAWAPVKGASYYNVQLMRGRKVLSAWPERPSFRLRRTWLYQGRRYRLQPGTYRWYVWPAFKRRNGVRYGRLLGSSTFVVAR
jgi:hypothetical protein